MYLPLLLVVAALLGNAFPCALPEQNHLTFAIVSLLRGANAIINLIFALITLVVGHSHTMLAKPVPVRVRACRHKSHIKDLESEKAKYNVLRRQYIDDSNQYVKEIAELTNRNKELTTDNDYLAADNRNKKFTIKELRRNLSAANKHFSKQPPLRIITTAEKHKASGYDKVIQLRAEVEQLQKARRDDEYKMSRLRDDLQLANTWRESAEETAREVPGLKTTLELKQNFLRKVWKERCELKIKVEEYESEGNLPISPSPSTTQGQQDAEAEAEPENEDDEDEVDDGDEYEDIEEEEEDAEEDDEDDEDWDDEEGPAEEAAVAPAPAGRSIWDRLTMDPNGNPVRDIKAVMKMGEGEEEGEPKNIFAYLAKK